jgi:hypothetical protein
MEAAVALPTECAFADEDSCAGFLAGALAAGAALAPAFFALDLGAVTVTVFKTRLLIKGQKQAVFFQKTGTLARLRVRDCNKQNGMCHKKLKKI